ncbi:S-adenosylmethionine-dependent methyltransferase [Dichotomopilus funicola]|uniref:S-adenosylmethionine-dependent methyltransferase n=1 Tax=Dichotomopilus funicola TaxID=1934379 RepID=A0AAN6ZRQ2_9PEZI|nr:S-adenosylmethionine-dependent methyltransferase [Dichotomopilus funicola]
MLLPVAEDEFPHLWQRPSYEVLLARLQKLRVEPRVWGLRDSRAEILKDQAATAHDKREIISFLSTIISSSLGWLGDDDEREVIWEEASKRMSERCGRTAMGEITRCWPFSSRDYGAFDLTIREPPLVGDSLGLKTWGSSYALAQLLQDIAARCLTHLFVLGAMSSSHEVLELGSGTGLLGLAAACTWRTSVVLTDLPEIIPNLAYNVSLNQKVVEDRGGKVEATPLTWGSGREGTAAMFRELNRYKLIIVADPLYDDDHPDLLSAALDEQLSKCSDARALIMVPQRDEITQGLLNTLRDSLARSQNPLVCLEENVVAGQDDWGDDDNSSETSNIGFWWGVFGRGRA